MDRILTPSFKLEPGDGTGCSIADAQVRNARGECAAQGCGKPMNPEGRWRPFGGILCNDCHAKVDAEVREMLRKNDEDLVATLRAVQPIA